jgi:hypothetical protein
VVAVLKARPLQVQVLDSQAPLNKEDLGDLSLIPLVVVAVVELAAMEIIHQPTTLAVQGVMEVLTQHILVQF